MPRNSGENHRFHRGKLEVDFRSVRSADGAIRFFAAADYLPFFGPNSSTHSPFKQSPTPPLAA